MAVKIGLIKIYQHEFDLCEEACVTFLASIPFADLEIVRKLRQRCNALLNKVHTRDEVVRLTDEMRCPQAITRLSRKYNCPVKSRLVSEQLARSIIPLINSFLS